MEVMKGQTPPAPTKFLDKNFCLGARTGSTSVNLIQVTPLGYFIHISITTPIVPALKNYYIWSFLEVPTDILNARTGQFWPNSVYAQFGLTAVLVVLGALGAN
jgi:hypothetical protein